MTNVYEQIQFSKNQPPPDVPSDFKTQMRAMKPVKSSESTSEAQNRMQCAVEKNPKHPIIKRKRIRKRCYILSITILILGLCSFSSGILLATLY